MQTRLGAALTLYAFAGLGLFLLIAPWTPVWTQATYALLPGPVGRWVLSGWARGVATGLGALDLVIAAQVGVELLERLRERPGDDRPTSQQKKGGA